MSDPNIRQATAADLPGIQQLDAFSRRNALRLGAINTAIDAGLAKVLVQDDAVLGYGLVHSQFFEQTFVALLVIDEAWRGRGFGPLLLLELTQLAVTDQVFTSTNQSNLHMQHVLTKAGWQRCGLVDELDVGDPEVFYTLRLK